MEIRMMSEEGSTSARRRGGHSGFTLIEVLVAMVLVVIALVSLAPVLVHSLLLQKEAQTRWEQSVECWNRVQLLRAGQGEFEPQSSSASPVGAPLHRYRISASTGDGAMEWEVLDASKQRLLVD